MAPFPCIATNTSPPLGGGAKKYGALIASIQPPFFTANEDTTARPPNGLVGYMRSIAAAVDSKALNN